MQLGKEKEKLLIHRLHDHLLKIWLNIPKKLLQLIKGLARLQETRLISNNQFYFHILLAMQLIRDKYD